MQYKIININDLTPELTQKYFYMLSEKKQALISSLPEAKNRAIAFCSEIIARQCLSNELKAPESAFSLLLNANAASAVGNFSAEICVASTGDVVGCAVDKNPIGISITNIEPFDFLSAQSICSDSEISDIYSFSRFSFADIIKQPQCNEKTVDERFACFKSLKEAQYRASGRMLKKGFTYADYKINENSISCSDGEYEVLKCEINLKYNVVVSVIRRNKV